MSRPPLGLSVNTTDATGAVTRWSSEDRDPENRPQNIAFGSQRMQGFASASVDLSRRIDRDYVDIHLYDDLEIIGDDGSTAWEGRVGANPRSVDKTHTMTVQAAGWMAHARDRKFTAVYVDRDLNKFAGAASGQQITNHATTYPHSGSATVTPDESGTPALILQQERIANTAGGQRYIVEAWYDIGAGNSIGAVYADMTSVNLGGDWLVQRVLSTNDFHSANFEGEGNLGSAYSGYYTATASGRRYLALQMLYNNTFTGDSLWQAKFRKLAVYGDHGVTRHGSAPGGLYASDVLRHIIANHCPMLNASGIQDTTYAIPHLVYRDPTDPYDAFLDINKYHLWDLSIWEGRTAYYTPIDLTDFDWDVRLDDPGTSTTLQGDSTEDLANGIAVTFSNVMTGQTVRLTPDSHAELRDDSVEHPATRHGLQVWTEYQISAPTTLGAALQIGRAALAEFNAPKAPGSITVGPYVRDRQGHWQQAWKIRAGDRIAITSSTSLSDRPRVAHDVSYAHGPNGVGRATIAVDSTFRTLPAVLDRIDTALTAAGLT